jgi:hypothetical protein
MAGKMITKENKKGKYIILILEKTICDLGNATYNCFYYWKCKNTTGEF